MKNKLSIAPLTVWILSLMMLSVLIAIPGGPFSFWVLIPVILCFLFDRYKFEIVFLFSLITGFAFTNNFFAVHLFTYESIQPKSIIYGATRSLSITHTTLSGLLGFALYLCVFFALVKMHKLLFKNYNIFSSLFFTFVPISLVWLSWKFLPYTNSLVYAFSLAMLMMSRHLFYLFNYVKFIDHFPRNKKEWSAIIQPYWFLIFETPESPFYEVDEERKDFNQTISSAAGILFSALVFKVVMIIYMSGLSFILKGRGEWVLNDAELVNKTCIEILSQWKSQNIVILFLCLFSYSLSYLLNNFFIYGRIIIALARLCGFHLPDYINKPWRAQSFSDFFSRTMYYYNIIIVNHFFYPALEFVKRFSLSRKMTIFLSLNYALIVGGFLARFMRDIWKVYRFGFGDALYKLSSLALPYMIVLSLAVTISLYFQKKTSDKKMRPGHLLFYIFLFALIMPFNFSQVFGGIKGMMAFYFRLFTFGILS